MGESLCRKQDLGKLFPAVNSMAEAMGVCMVCSGNCKPFGIAKKGTCRTWCGWQFDLGAHKGLWCYYKDSGLYPEVTESMQGFKLCPSFWLNDSGEQCQRNARI